MDAKTTPSILTSVTEKFRELIGFRRDAAAQAFAERKQALAPLVTRAHERAKEVRAFARAHRGELRGLLDLAITPELQAEPTLAISLERLAAPVHELTGILDTLPAFLARMADAVQAAERPEALDRAEAELRDYHSRQALPIGPVLEGLLARATERAGKLEPLLATLRATPAVDPPAVLLRPAKYVEWPPSRPESQTTALTDFDVFGGGGGQR